MPLSNNTTDKGFVDHSWSLRVYWDAVDANKNDNTIFNNTVIDGMKSTEKRPSLLLNAFLTALAACKVGGMT